MGKFLSRFVLGTAVGLALFWLWGQLNRQDDGDFEDDEVIEIQIGGDKRDSTATKQQKTEVAQAERNADRAAGSAAVATHNVADTGSDDGAANLEWVNGIGPMFNSVLAEHGIRTNKDLAKATVAQLRATDINRSDEEFASWIQQAKDKLAGK